MRQPQPYMGSQWKAVRPSADTVALSPSWRPNSKPFQASKVLVDERIALVKTLHRYPEVSDKPNSGSAYAVE